LILLKLVRRFNVLIGEFILLNLLLFNKSLLDVLLIESIYLILKYCHSLIYFKKLKVLVIQLQLMDVNFLLAARNLLLHFHFHLRLQLSSLLIQLLVALILDNSIVYLEVLIQLFFSFLQLCKPFLVCLSAQVELLFLDVHFFLYFLNFISSLFWISLIYLFNLFVLFLILLNWIILFLFCMRVNLLQDLFFIYQISIIYLSLLIIFPHPVLVITLLL
jgi:hypothetical protein